MFILCLAKYYNQSFKLQTISIVLNAMCVEKFDFSASLPSCYTL